MADISGLDLVVARVAPYIARWEVAKADSDTKMRRNYRKEYENYQSKPKQRRNNDKRKAARRLMEKEGKVKKGDGKDVAHKKPLAKGGSNKKGNLKVANRSKNRSFKRTKTARMA
tara:strand:- start:302 stop:646 length:345 start_codon:yes stop_codon:yes gene_type:complete